MGHLVCPLITKGSSYNFSHVVFFFFFNIHKKKLAKKDNTHSRTKNKCHTSAIEKLTVKEFLENSTNYLSI